MPKPPSQTAAAKPKKMPSQTEIDALTRDLVDRPYGEQQPKVKKAKPVTISLHPSMIEQLEDLALKNKRAGTGPKTVSAIIRDALAASGFVNY
uniref:ribbon-helix-helix domain-containing protein n=1 Tax=Pseudomonas sp. TaxID=306 RepID=UPI0011654BBE|nr:ribbon-helix-helix domain-containing protein [Pseudomonas sp.]QDK64840.1 partition protein ParB [Pseudomonas sp.]